MATKISIPRISGECLSLEIPKGSCLFLLGANGSGKSALVQHIFKDSQNIESQNKVLRISAHRQTWFSSDSLDMSPQSRNYIRKNGDVFELTETKQQFILICQPCELMIRGDGSRTVYDAVLLPLKFRKIKPKKVDDFKAKRRPEIYSFYESISTVVDKGAYSVELNKPTTVNLSFLDLCCFNEDGALMLNKATTPHSALLTKGLKTRFEKYQKLVLEKTAKEIKKSALGNLIYFPTPLFAKDSSLLSGVTLTQRKGCVSAPIRRINRVRDALAEEILADFYRYKARKAWGADFLGEVQ